ncbi:hypothetical protein PENSUB_9490 [Penicillium subrubescens]|uniref:Uncharacterized protein n=1 Tax=Penicillium subrubescens TaxID=1316194 RepID=A0A1Q5TDU2_9EURO|nr:hypothetical protein PENSUB_9490 [Penicillium subrubescens]
MLHGRSSQQNSCNHYGTISLIVYSMECEGVEKMQKMLPGQDHPVAKGVSRVTK